MGGLCDEARCGPVRRLGVEVGSDGNGGVGGIDVDIEAVDKEQRSLFVEGFGGALDGDGAGFAGGECDVVFRIEDRENTLAGFFSMQLQVSHERDGGRGIAERDGKQRI